MKKLTKTDVFKHLSVIIFFIITSLLFFSPVLKGKKILQNDIVQYNGMAKELKDFRDKNDQETYWVNNAFSGMPTYQLGAKYPHNYIKQLDLLVRFLPRPADYLFLYFLGFYFLMLSLKVEYRLALLGALSFGLSTYLIIIIGAGHNAKAHAISYMPFVLGSIIYVVRKKYLLGFFLTTIFLGLQFTSNHFQMTYYLMFIVIIMAVWFTINCVKEKDFNHLKSTVFTLFSALIFSLLLNSSNLLATIEYSGESTRGDASSLTINPDGSKKLDYTVGLNREYITQWSYGIFESLNLFIPKIMGGGSSENLDKKSSFYKLLRSNGYGPIESSQIIKNSPTYWGDQPFVEAPAYLGIVVFFLFVFSVFLYRGKHRGWLLASIILSLLLSFGKNFSLLTDLFIDYFPIYDKFRAVSSIQVILELCIPVFAVLGLSKLISGEVSYKSKLKALRYSVILFVSILSLLFLSKAFLSFSGISDQYLDESILEALITDRKKLYTDQLVRTIIYLSAVSFLFWFYIRSLSFKNHVTVKLNNSMKIKGFIIFIVWIIILQFIWVEINTGPVKFGILANFIYSIFGALLGGYITSMIIFKIRVKEIYLILSVGFIIVFDLITFSKNYVNDNNFVDPFIVENPFEKDDIYRSIAEDGSDFRVLDLTENSTKPNYFFNSVNGYHAAKLGRYNDLMEFYLNKTHLNTLSMLNTKYIIFEQEGIKEVYQNDFTSGSAWFVKENINVKNDDQEIKILDSLNFRDVSISQSFSDKTYQNINSSVVLSEKSSNFIKYNVSTDDTSLLIFSEIFYPKGWKSYVNGKETPNYRFNYVLRGLEVPRGVHEIEFIFDPDVVKLSSKISLFSSLGFIMLIFILILRRKN